MTLFFQEMHFYSPLLDSEAIRLSVADEQSREYFAIIGNPGSGKAYRAKREETINLICQAIDMGLDPGEVVTT